MNKSIAILAIAGAMAIHYAAVASPEQVNKLARVDAAPIKVVQRIAPAVVSKVESEQLRKQSVAMIQQQLNAQIKQQMTLGLTQ